MFAFGSLAGFEATDPYGEEAKNPRRSVPRATCIALAAITGFYLVTLWAAITSCGVTHVKAAAAAPQTFIFAAVTKYVSGGMSDAMEALEAWTQSSTPGPCSPGYLRNPLTGGGNWRITSHT